MGKTALLQRTVTRRNLIEGGIAAGALVALGGTVKAFAGEGDLLRPPGAQDEQSLLSLCIRCDRCRSACPTNAIGVGHLCDGIINARVPVMDFRSGFCDMCGGDFKCLAACPVAAIKPFRDEHVDKIRHGGNPDGDVCRLFGVSAHCNAPCIDSLRLRCRFPLTAMGAFAFDESACNGCGACENACPASSYGKLRRYQGGGNKHCSPGKEVAHDSHSKAVRFLIVAVLLIALFAGWQTGTVQRRLRRYRVYLPARCAGNHIR